MKIQLDTKKKSIKIEEPINLGEFIKTLEELLPNKKWKEFEIEVGTIINWGEPINITSYPTVIIPSPSPLNPYTYPWYSQPSTIYCGNQQGTSNATNVMGVLNEGIYNVMISN